MKPCIRLEPTIPGEIVEKKITFISKRNHSQNLIDCDQSPQGSDFLRGVRLSDTMSDTILCSSDIIFCTESEVINWRLSDTYIPIRRSETLLTFLLISPCYI